MRRVLDPRELLALAVPQGVLTAASRVAADHDPPLLAEADGFGPATWLRRNGFATSRQMARELLVEAGYEHATIERRADGAPIWPAGLCGSFSYKDEWCAVAVAKSPPDSALGIDIERFEAVPGYAWDDIVSPQELRCFSPRRALRPPQLVNLAFTAKEAYFKAQCSITGDAGLEFRDVELAIDSNNGRLSLSPLPSGFQAIAQIRWSDRWCAAAVALRPAETDV